MAHYVRDTYHGMPSDLGKYRQKQSVSMQSCSLHIFSHVSILSFSIISIVMPIFVVSFIICASIAPLSLI